MDGIYDARKWRLIELNGCFNKRPKPLFQTVFVLKYLNEMFYLLQKLNPQTKFEFKKSKSMSRSFEFEMFFRFQCQNDNLF